MVPRCLSGPARSVAVVSWFERERWYNEDRFVGLGAAVRGGGGWGREETNIILFFEHVEYE